MFKTNTYRLIITIAFLQFCYLLCVPLIAQNNIELDSILVNNNTTNIVTQDNFSIYLTAYQIYNKHKKENQTIVALDKDISSFTIPYKQNYLTLKFVINDVLNTNQNIYQHRILEISEEWISLDNYSILHLRGLNPGNYSLEVRGLSNNGNSTNILRYKIKVKQVFYKQAWFVSLIIIAAYIFIFYRNKRRSKYIEKHYQQKNKILQLEAKALRAQMNPHFIFNTLNGMQSVMILKGEREANKYFSTFSKLLRFTLDMSNTEYIVLKDEIDYLKSYLELENLRLNNSIKTEFNIDEKLDLENYCIPCMLFQPIIENAIIHGLAPKKENRKLTITFKKEDDFLVGLVTDNGIGRNESQKRKQEKENTHKSWATRIMKERIVISNAIMKEQITLKIIDLKDNNNTALGTRVKLQIPLLTIVEAQKPNDFQ